MQTQQRLAAQQAAMPMQRQTQMQTASTLPSCLPWRPAKRWAGGALRRCQKCAGREALAAQSRRAVALTLLPLPCVLCCVSQKAEEPGAAHKANIQGIKVLSDAERAQLRAAK